MKIFCRLYGHTWLHESEHPKITWHNDKSGTELKIATEGEPTFYRRCVRCGERQPWSPEESAASR
jgi:hypothetical protein